MNHLSLLIVFFLYSFFCTAQPEFVGNVAYLATNFTNVNGTLFFSSADTLYKSDGTIERTEWIKKNILRPGEFKDINGMLYFLANKQNTYPFHFKELWASDGTSQGTSLIKDFKSIKILTNIGDALFLAADDGIHGIELWKVEKGGQPFLIKDFFKGSSLSSHLGYDVAGDYLYIIAFDSLNTKTELYKTDGTTTGTTKVSVDTSYFSRYNRESFWIYASGPTNLKNVNGRIFFDYGFIQKIPYGEEGTFLATIGVNDGHATLKQEVPSLGVYGFTCVGDELFFCTSFESGVGEYLWRSDGTSEGTYKLKSITRDGSIENLISINGKLIFTSDYQNTSDEIWIADRQSADHFRSCNKSGLSNLVDMGNGPYALAIKDYFLFIDNAVYDQYGDIDGGYNLELWQSDLTLTGTNMVKQIFSNGNTNFSNTSNLTKFNDILYFTTADNEKNGVILTHKKLWKYDPYTAIINSYLKSEEKLFELYPNPASNEVNIHVSKAGSCKIDFANVLGEIIYTTSVTTTRITINLDQLQIHPGIYYVKIRRNDEEQIVKLVKR
jgi:ELWxxDGT repeat protein